MKKNKDKKKLDSRLKLLASTKNNDEPSSVFIDQPLNVDVSTPELVKEKTKSFDVIFQNSSLIQTINDSYIRAKCSKLAEFMCYHKEIQNSNTAITASYSNNKIIDINILELNTKKFLDEKKNIKNKENKYYNISKDLQNLNIDKNTKEKEQSHKQKNTLSFLPEKTKTNVPKPVEPKIIDNTKDLEHIKSTIKNTINLVICGHVDAGKSTIVGHLMILMKIVKESKLRKYKKESELIGKKSFALAWVMDSSVEERERGVTIDVAKCSFETERFIVNIMDAPGHADFIKNMIVGAQQADLAVLVVDSTVNGFEAGFNSQTKEHAILCRSLGIQNIIVAVNKLEQSNWSKERFDEIQYKMTEFLTQNGYKEEYISYIPLSGLLGVNIVDNKKNEKELSEWYTGCSLVEQIDKTNLPIRPIEKPLRIKITDYYQGGDHSTSSAYVTIAGIVVQGYIKFDQKIALLPIGKTGTVKSLKTKDTNNTELVSSGQHCTIQIDNIELIDIQPGSVINDINNRCSIAKNMECRILVFDIKMPIINGTSIIVHINNIETQATITKIKEIVSSTAPKKNPRHLIKKQTAIVNIITTQSICVEPFEKNKELSRILIRRGRESVACGVILTILDNE